MLISFAVTAKLICAVVFAYAKCCFSHVAVQVMSTSKLDGPKCPKTPSELHSDSEIGLPGDLWLFILLRNTLNINVLCFNSNSNY